MGSRTPKQKLRSRKNAHLVQCTDTKATIFLTLLAHSRSVIFHTTVLQTISTVWGYFFLLYHFVFHASFSPKTSGIELVKKHTINYKNEILLFSGSIYINFKTSNRPVSGQNLKSHICDLTVYIFQVLKG